MPGGALVNLLSLAPRVDPGRAGAQGRAVHGRQLRRVGAGDPVGAAARQHPGRARRRRAPGARRRSPAGSTNSG
ncbi:hypothetical protein LT493_25635 [Streptomyces tricolor]|nr:hypothetical protein [Streptomyces tricolor]